MSEKYQLTPVEHELMEILWKIEQGTVRDVIAQLSSNRNLAYTSVSTILRILQQKKILAVKKIGRQHIYKPILTKETFATATVARIIRDIFSGKSIDLIAYLIEKNGMSTEEINIVQKLLNTKKQVPQ